MTERQDHSPARVTDDPISLQRVRSWDYLHGKARFFGRDHVLETATNFCLKIPGHILEFGVFEGRSISKIRDVLDAHYSKHKIRRKDRKLLYGFDSFKGLPERFENLEAGWFATTVPSLKGVQLVEGYFEQSLTPDLAHSIGRVSLAHLDADL